MSQLHVESSDDESTYKYTGRCDFENFKKWPPAAAQLLINLRLSLDDKFAAGYVMKKTLWKKISQILIENGFEFSPGACEAKFKGIKLTYKRNMKKLKTSPDAEILWPYFKLLHERYGETDQRFEDQTDDSLSKDCFEGGSGNEYNPNANENETTGIHIKWPYTAIESLITLRLSMEQNFHCAYGSKKLLWNKISTELNKHGFLYSADACATKFKGLLVTYKRNLKNLEENGKEVIWPYFAKLHKVFGDNKNTLIKYISQTNEISGDQNCTNEVNDNQTLHISDDDETKIWNAGAIRLIIIKRGEMNNKFISGRCPKKDLWVEIADSLKAHGIETDGEACREKFKGLILTYRRNLKKYFEFNKKSITWPFFNLMHQKFGKNKLQVKQIQQSNINENCYFQESSNDSLSNEDIADIFVKSNTSDNEDSEDCYPKERWNFESISKLLQMRLNMKEDFEAGIISEFNLWKDVSKKIKLMGFKFSDQDCHIKFESIFETYTMFKTQNNLFENRCTWPFFPLMEQIFPNDLYEFNRDNQIAAKFENQKIVKKKVTSHILTEMFHSSSSDEVLPISENESRIYDTRKRRGVKFSKLMEKRLKLEEKRNQLLERKIEVAEKKTLIFTEFVNILKQNKNCL